MFALCGKYTIQGERRKKNPKTVRLNNHFCSSGFGIDDFKVAVSNGLLHKNKANKGCLQS